MPLHALIIHVFWNDSIFAQTVFKMFFFPRLKLHKTQIDLSCSSQTMTFFFGSVYWPTFFGLVSHPYPLKSGDYSPSKCYEIAATMGAS